MNQILQTLKKSFHIIKGFFPSALPTGLRALDEFSTSIFETYDLPDLPSYRHAIASMIMHLSPTTAYKPKRFFALSVKKAMSNQIAYEKIQSLKKQEDEYIQSTLTVASSLKDATSDGPEIIKSTVQDSAS